MGAVHKIPHSADVLVFCWQTSGAVILSVTPPFLFKFVARSISDGSTSFLLRSHSHTCKHWLCRTLPQRTSCVLSPCNGQLPLICSLPSVR